MIASFSCIHILLGNVVTQLMFGGIFNNNIIANCPYNVPVKNFENWLIFSKDIDKNKVACFYGPRCTTCLLYTSPSPRDRTRSRMPSSA